MRSLFKQFSVICFVILGMLYLNSCHDHDEENTTTIEIVSPKSGSKVLDSKKVEVHVKFTATTELHNMAIKLHPDANPSNNIIDWDKHNLEKAYEYKVTKDLSSFPAGTKFRLKVELCEDHDCKNVKLEDIEFTI
jgi:hypothetical protein